MSDIELEIYDSGTITLDIDNGDTEFGVTTGGSDKNYIQAFTAASIVHVAHNLGKYPAIQIFDSANDQCEGQVVHTDTNNLVVTFTAAFTGTITCN